jgi:hypothetical protein
MYVGSRRRMSVAAVAELPAAPVLPRGGRVVGGVCGGACEPRTTSRDLHRLFIALCDAGLPTMDWLGAPDQGARPSPLRMRDRSNV